MIAFTNHALDHLLGSVLDAGITKKVVRLGSRCNDERVSPFSIEELERNSTRSRLAHHLRGAMQELKGVEAEMKELIDIEKAHTFRACYPWWTGWGDIGFPDCKASGPPK